MAAFARRAAITALAATTLTVPLTLAPAAHAVPTRAPAAARPMPGAHPSMAMTDMANRYAAALRHLHGAPFERAFISGMIPHHAAAVAMARLELARGTHPQVKAMAQRIIAGQSREIGQMTGWLRTWDRLTPAQAERRAPAEIRMLNAMMGSDMRAMVTRLAAIPAGARFDKAFMTEMVPHHQTAVVEARTIPGRATHRQLATLGSNIVAGQTAEIRQMRTWLRAWYRTTA